MTVNDMTCIERDKMNQGQGALYQNIITVLNGLSSHAYFVPVQNILGIFISITGNGAVMLTSDSRSTIAAGTADWTAWDGSSLINPAATGIYVTSTSGTVVVKLTVRTAGY